MEHEGPGVRWPWGEFPLTRQCRSALLHECQSCPVLNALLYPIDTFDGPFRWEAGLFVQASPRSAVCIRPWVQMAARICFNLGS